MILMLAAVIIVIVVASVLMGGSTLLIDRPRQLLGGAGGPLGLLAGAGAVVIVLALAAVAVLGVDRGGEHEDEAPVATEAVPPKASPKEVALESGGNRQVPTPPQSGRHEVALRADAPVAVVERLEPASVLRVTATGFKPLTEGFVAQCAFRGGTPRSCTNRFPVVVDSAGTARFQYLVTDRVRGDGPCGPSNPPCALLVEAAEVRAVALTVFGGSAPASGFAQVTPSFDLTDGDAVDVRLTGFPAATRVSVASCAADGGCRPQTAAVTAADGSARLQVRIEGADGAACSGRHPCHVAVAVDAAVPPVTVPLLFATEPSAGYEGARLGVGLALAALLLAVAAWLVRTGDWGTPAEAATPAMDAAVLDG